MSQTEADLLRVFASQSVEAVRNEARATIASRQGRTQESHLFRALSVAQKKHADKALLLLRGNLPLTDENMEAVKDSLNDMEHHLKSMIMTAARESQPQVEATVIQFHKAIKSQQAAVRNMATAQFPYAVCEVCGYITEGTAPERCPVCRAAPEQFTLAEL